MSNQHISQLRGFLSYCRADDKAENGRILQIAEDVADQFALLTGEEIEIFRDVQDLTYGEDWREKIYQKLELAAFFMPIITPRYIKSPSCTEEFNQFIAFSQKLGVENLFISIIYQNFDEFRNTDPEDEDASSIIKTIKKYHYVDWAECVFEDRSSGKYRKAINQIATDLKNAKENMVSAVFDGTVTQNIEANDTSFNVGVEDLGFIDLLANLQEALPRLNNIIVELGETSTEIAECLTKETKEIEKSDKAGKGFSGRKFIAARTARYLEAPAEKMVNLANKYSLEIAVIDAGLSPAINQLTKEAKQPDATVETKRGAENFFRNIKQFVDSGLQMNDTAAEAFDAYYELQNTSRDLRQPMIKICQAMEIIMKSKKTFMEWNEIIPESSPEI